MGVGIQGRKSQWQSTPLTRNLQAILYNRYRCILCYTHDHCLCGLLYIYLQNSWFAIQQENTVGGGWSTVILCYWMNMKSENTTHPLTQLPWIDLPNLGSRFKWTRGTCNDCHHRHRTLLPTLSTANMLSVNNANMVAQLCNIILCWRELSTRRVNDRPRLLAV